MITIAAMGQCESCQAERPMKLLVQSLGRSERHCIIPLLYTYPVLPDGWAMSSVHNPRLTCAECASGEWGLWSSQGGGGWERDYNDAGEPVPRRFASAVVARRFADAYRPSHEARKLTATPLAK
jgi:hypothetical protein